MIVGMQRDGDRITIHYAEDDAGLVYALDVAGLACWPATRDHAIDDLDHGAQAGDIGPSREERLSRVGLSA